MCTGNEMYYVHEFEDWLLASAPIMLHPLPILCEWQVHSSPILTTPMCTVSHTPIPPQ